MKRFDNLVTTVLRQRLKREIERLNQQRILDDDEGMLGKKDYTEYEKFLKNFIQFLSNYDQKTMPLEFYKKEAEHSDDETIQEKIQKLEDCELEPLKYLKFQIEDWERELKER